jgi:regulator of replication initiation timing
MITQAQLEELRADDGNIAIRPIHQGTGEAKDLEVDVTDLLKKNTEQAAEIVKLKGENEHLKKNLSETNVLLEQATKPAQELVRKVSGRRATG